ncbi:outer membrane beta-barrel protein [Haliangium sp.]|uniref:outer membrane beta-barrel protein n=1 Tax=Haliangium sp. TaxID=2663208 RepID=UPI003D0EB86A
MKTARRIIPLAFIALLASAATASAEEPLRIEKAERAHSINVSPLGLVLGYYSVNYEHLFEGGHGLMAEGIFARYDLDDDPISLYGGGVGYRWHWSGRQNSGFLGVSAGFGYGNGFVRTTENNMTQTSDLTTRTLYLTGNIGKRWAWDNGLNITARIGAGYGNYKVTTDSMDPEARQQAEDLHDQLSPVSFALDAELSVGYAF